jgi:hypothetical protein
MTSPVAASTRMTPEGSQLADHTASKPTSIASHQPATSID